MRFPLFFLSFVLILTGCTENENNAPRAASGPMQILIVGGNTSHDFERWFHQEDAATLSVDEVESVYTEDPDGILPHLENIDVLYLSNNQALPDTSLRNAIFAFADEGKGLLLVHPALWYNMDDWPEYYSELVGGGSRSHGPYGPFEVTVIQENHPVMQGVPAKFTLEDELYRFEMDPNGAIMNILAIGTEPDTGEQFPVVWTIDHPTRRIVCITLGHDGATHESEAYKTLLRNSLQWLMR